MVKPPWLPTYKQTEYLLGVYTLPQSTTHQIIPYRWNRSADDSPACSSDRRRPNGQFLLDWLPHTRAECWSFFIEPGNVAQHSAHVYGALPPFQWPIIPSYIACFICSKKVASWQYFFECFISTLRTTYQSWVAGKKIKIHEFCITKKYTPIDWQLKALDFYIFNNKFFFHLSLISKRMVTDEWPWQGHLHGSVTRPITPALSPRLLLKTTIWTRLIQGWYTVVTLRKLALRNAKQPLQSSCMWTKSACKYAIGDQLEGNATMGQKKMKTSILEKKWQLIMIQSVLSPPYVGNAVAFICMVNVVLRVIFLYRHHFLCCVLFSVFPYLCDIIFFSFSFLCVVIYNPSSFHNTHWGQESQYSYFNCLKHFYVKSTSSYCIVSTFCIQ